MKNNQIPNDYQKSYQSKSPLGVIDLKNNFRDYSRNELQIQNRNVLGDLKYYQRSSFNTVQGPYQIIDYVLQEKPHHYSVLNSKTDLNSVSNQNQQNQYNNFQTVQVSNYPAFNQEFNSKLLDPSKQTISTIQNTADIRDRENDFMVTPKIMDYTKNNHKNRKDRKESSIDAYGDFPLQMKTENKYKNYSALTSQRALLIQDQVLSHTKTAEKLNVNKSKATDNFNRSNQLNMIQTNNNGLVDNRIFQQREESAKTRRDKSQMINDQFNTQRNQYKNLEAILSPGHSQNVLQISKPSSIMVSSIETSRDKTQAIEKSHNDLFKQLTIKIQHLNQVKDSLWYLVNSASLDHLTKDQRVPMPFLEKQQRIYEEMSSIQVELDYLMQLFQIHLRTLLLRDQKLVSRKKHYKHQLKKAKNQLQQNAIKEILEPQGNFGTILQGGSTSRQSNIQTANAQKAHNLTNISSNNNEILKNYQHNRNSSIEKDNQSLILQKTEQQTKTIIQLQKNLSEMQELIDQRDREILTLRNSLKMLEEDRIVEKIRYKQASCSQISLQSIVDKVSDLQSNNKSVLKKEIDCRNSKKNNAKLMTVERERESPNFQDSTGTKSLVNLEDSMSGNQKFADLLNECNKHIHEKSDLFNESTSKNQNSQKDLLDKDMLNQIIDMIEQKYRAEHNQNQQMKSSELEHNAFGIQQIYQSQGQNLSAYLNPNESSQIQSNSVKQSQYQNQPTSSHLAPKDLIYDQKRVNLNQQKSRNVQSTTARTQDITEDHGSKKTIQILEEYQDQQLHTIDSNRNRQQFENKNYLLISENQDQFSEREVNKVQHAGSNTNKSKNEQKEQLFKEKFQKIKSESHSNNITQEHQNNIGVFQRKESSQRRGSRDSDISEKIKKAEEELQKVQKLQKARQSQQIIQTQNSNQQPAKQSIQISNQTLNSGQKSQQQYSKIHQKQQALKSQRRLETSPNKLTQDSNQKQQILTDDEDLLIQGLDQEDWPRGNPIDSSRLQSKISIAQSNTLGSHSQQNSQNDLHAVNSIQNLNSQGLQDQIQKREFNRFGFKLRQKSKNSQEYQN
eukprot:403376871